MVTLLSSSFSLMVAARDRGGGCVREGGGVSHTRKGGERLRGSSTIKGGEKL